MSEEVTETILKVWEQEASRKADLHTDVIRFLEQERDEWKERAIAAEQHLDAIHARFFDLLERPAGL